MFQQLADKGINTRGRAALFLLPSAMILILAFLPQVSEQLAFKRDAIDAGQWWRIVSGNFVHFTHYHATMNALGLAAFSFLLFGQGLLFRWLLCFLAVNLSVGVGLYLFDIELYEYRGMSGAIYGMLAAGLLINLSRRLWIHGLVLIGLLAKVVYEQLPVFDANYLAEQVGAPVAANAHLFGAATGVVVGLVLRLYNALFCKPVAVGE